MRTALLTALLLASGAAAAEDPAALVDRLAAADPAERASAKEALERAGAAALPALRAGLGAPSATIATACVEILAEGGFRSARDDVRRLLDDPRAARMVRRACALTLGRVGDERDTARLLEIAPEFPEAALALAALADPAARAPLAEMVTAGRGGPEAAFALASFGDPAGVEALIAALGGPEDLRALLLLRRLAGRDPGTSPDAWRAWWRVERWRRALGAAEFEASESALEAALKDPAAAPDLVAVATDALAPGDARTKALLALGLRGDPSVLPVLLRLLEEDADGMVRLYAAEAVGRLGDPSAAISLVAYLVFDEEPFRKRSAKDRSDVYYTIDSAVCRALTRLGICGGLDYMIRQLDQEHRVRVYHEALRTLRETLDRDFDYRPDGDRRSRRAAAARARRWFDEERDGLRLPGPDLAEPRFRAGAARYVDRLAHFSFLAMSRARECLVLLGEAALPELRAGLERPEMHIRVHCAEILGRIRSRTCRPDLLRRLADEAPEVRAAAVAALGAMGPGRAAEEGVLRALGDVSADVRIEAARALARVPAERALPALQAAAERPENRTPAFLREACFARAVHGDASAVSDLGAMLAHRDAAFRRTVADRLQVLTGFDAGADEGAREAFLAYWEAERSRYGPPEGFATDR